MNHDLDPNKWFTEINADSAYSLRIKRKVHEEKTPYQEIAIYETEKFGYLMVIDGCVMLTERDNFLYHEMMSHPALFTHHHPEHIVIIGGGDCGTLREVLKHKDVKSAQQIDIDEQVTRLAEKYFPILCEKNTDPRAALHFCDGLDWMAKTPKNTVDVIIIDSTDPVGPAEQLFGAPFYQDCFAALRDGGIIVHQSESPLYHPEIIKKMHRDMKKVGFAETKTLYFPQPCYPSGWWSATLSIKGRVFSGFREKESAGKKFDTLYYNVDIHRGALATPEWMRN